MYPRILTGEFGAAGFSMHVSVDVQNFLEDSIPYP